MPGTSRCARCSSRRSAIGYPRSPRRTPGKSGWRRVRPPSCGSRTRAAMADLDLDELRAELEDFAQPQKKGGRSPREERVIAGFEDILRFVDTHGHAPRHGETHDIFERLYAVRLDRIRAQSDCRELVAPLDRH